MSIASIISQMSRFKAFRWTLIGLSCGCLITAAGLLFNYAAPDKVWPVRLIRFTAQLGILTMVDWYPGHYIDRTPWASNLGLVIGGALQWGLLGFAYDLGQQLFAKQPRRN